MNQFKAQQPTAIGWYFLVFKKYFTLQGRARRSEYWFFVLFNIIASVIFEIIDAILGIDIVSFGQGSEIIELSLMSSIYSLIAFIPSITVGVRRLHDTGRSGWWQLSPLLSILIFFVGMLTGIWTPDVNLIVSFITFIGLIIMVFVFLVLDSQPFTNRYGPSPKATRFGH